MFREYNAKPTRNEYIFARNLAVEECILLTVYYNIFPFFLDVTLLSKMIQKVLSFVLRILVFDLFTKSVLLVYSVC
jgi:hypothetical protein